MDFESDYEIVELGECDSEQELLVVRALLESEGIECSGPVITSGWRVPGGLRVYVLKEDLAAARGILDASPELQQGASDDEQP
jgi:hypothetical protein